MKKRKLSANYMDLVFTKNVKPENLNIGDLIAYRVNNIVIIHEIERIKKEEKENKIVNVGNERDSWFAIDGCKLSGKPTIKGIYIHNGRKEAIVAQ